MADFSHLPSREVLAVHASAADELRRRGVTRSANNPVGDLAEFLFCRAFGWKMAPKSAKAADAVCAKGKLHQIKGRRINAYNRSRQLGAMGDLNKDNFNYLAAVLFNEDYSIYRAAIIPHSIVLLSATFVSHTKSWKFMLRDTVWDRPDTQDVTTALRSIEY